MTSKEMKSKYNESLVKEVSENPQYAKGRRLALTVALAALVLKMSEYLVSFLCGYPPELSTDLLLTAVILLMVTKFIMDGMTVLGGLYYLYCGISLAMQIVVASYYASGGSKSASITQFVSDNGFLGAWLMVITLGCLIFGIMLLAAPGIKYFRKRTKEITNTLRASLRGGY